MTLFLAGLLTMAAAAPPQYFGRDAAGAPPRPYSDAVLAGDTLYLSGQLGFDSAGKLPAGIEAQTRQTMENIGAILKRRGLSHDDLVKCLVMLDDMADWPAFNNAYTPYFKPGRLPARSAFAAKGLAAGAKVEVECIAHVATK